MSGPHLATMWRKSSISSQADNCVEVAFWPGATAVRDSKYQGAVLEFGVRAWSVFVRGLPGEADY